MISFVPLTYTFDANMDFNHWFYIHFNTNAGLLSIIITIASEGKHYKY